MKNKFLLLHIFMLVNLIFFEAVCLYCAFSHDGDYGNLAVAIGMLMLSYVFYKRFNIETKIYEYFAYEISLLFIDICYLFISVFAVSDLAANMALAIGISVMIIICLYCHFVLNKK